MILRFAFAALLYLFIFNLIVALRRDLSRQTRSIEERGAPRGPLDGRLIVLESALEGLERGQSLPLLPETIIGRSAESQLRLNDSFVSAQHVRLRMRRGRWYIEDLRSTNGTLLNQERLNGERPIEYGDVIGIGDTRLKLAR